MKGKGQMSEVYKERWYVAEICNDLYIHRDGDNEYLADVKDGETEEAWKRAHLMAAGPEMLEALEAASDFIEESNNCYFRMHIQETRLAVELAIKKARGEV